MIILIIVIGLTLLGAWILSPEINWIPKANDKNNEKHKKRELIKNEINEIFKH